VDPRQPTDQRLASLRHRWDQRTFQTLPAEGGVMADLHLRVFPGGGRATILDPGGPARPALIEVEWPRASTERVPPSPIARMCGSRKFQVGEDGYPKSDLL
jgi:hypothetical protein